MVKLFGIYVFNGVGGEAATSAVAKAVDLSSFSLFNRGSADEIMNFVARSVAKKTAPTQQQSVEHLTYVAYAHTAPSGLCAAVLADQDYPSRVAFTVAHTALQLFADQWASTRPPLPARAKAAAAAAASTAATSTAAPASLDDWLRLASGGADVFLFDAQFSALLLKAQTPEAVDDIEHIRKDLDATQETLHKTIKDLLVRGEKLDDLADQSEDLGMFSREFLKKSESMNACCNLL
jgi:synaptobrevin family protein YKT6